MRLRVKRLHPGAVLPAYQTGGAAGFDLHALESGYVAPGHCVLVPTGIAFEIPIGYEGTVRPRSGLAGAGIVGAFGTIDSDYRGGVAVLLFNHSLSTFWWTAGDRIGQLVISPVVRAELEDVGVGELSPTERGHSGFGSTGRAANTLPPRALPVAGESSPTTAPRTGENPVCETRTTPAYTTNPAEFSCETRPQLGAGDSVSRDGRLTEAERNRE